MITKVFYILMFSAGIVLGMFFGGWKSRHLNEAMEKLKADSKVVEEQREVLVETLRKEAEVAKDRLAQQEAQLASDKAKFDETQAALKRDRDATVSRLRKEADAAKAAGRGGEAAQKEQEADGLDCMDTPVPSETVRAINRASTGEK